MGTGDTDLSLALGDTERTAALGAGEIPVGISITPAVFLKIEEALGTLAPF